VDLELAAVGGDQALEGGGVEAGGGAAAGCGRGVVHPPILAYPAAAGGCEP
jgi:hypothetical protein